MNLFLFLMLLLPQVEELQVVFWFPLRAFYIFQNLYNTVTLKFF